jgi:alkylation response protein AidB-like acyl-CoA dehydrogenase
MKTLARTASRIALALGLAAALPAAAQAQDAKEAPKWDVAAPPGMKVRQVPIAVEEGTAGFSRSQPMDKIGLKAQDTSELFFSDVRVPAANLLGGPAHENRGFIALMEQLPWERLQIAIVAVAASEAAIAWTLDYVQQRKAFGQTLGSFQNTRHTLAEQQTQVQVRGLQQQAWAVGQ